MSLGLIIDKLGTSTPSTNINGEAPPSVCNEPLTPRNLIVGSPPKSPLGVETERPETEPCKALPTSVIGRVSKVFSASTVDTDPVKFDLLCVPYPTTTTSSKEVSSASSSTSKELPVTSISWVLNPILENRNVFPISTAIENFPSSSVIVLFAVPTTVTVTPSKDPAGPETVPVIVL